MSKRGKIIRTKVLQYACTFRREQKGGYTVRCTAFPGLITSGKTLEEARHNAREALELCLEVYRDKKWRTPTPDMEPRKTIKELVPAMLVRA